MTLHQELQKQKSSWETFQGNEMIECYSDTSIAMRPEMTTRCALDILDTYKLQRPREWRFDVL